MNLANQSNSHLRRLKSAFVAIPRTIGLAFCALMVLGIALLMRFCGRDMTYRPPLRVRISHAVRSLPLLKGRRCAYQQRY